MRGVLLLLFRFGGGGSFGGGGGGMPAKTATEGDEDKGADNPFDCARQAGVAGKVSPVTAADAGVASFAAADPLKPMGSSPISSCIPFGFAPPGSR